MTLAGPPSTGFALGTFSRAGGGPFAGLVVDGHVFDLRDAFGPDVTMLSLLTRWDDNLERLAGIAAGPPAPGAPTLASLEAHVPVASRQVLCAGANYTSHVRELAFAFLKRDGDMRSDPELRAAAREAAEHLRSEPPYIFAGLPSAQCGANADVVLWGPGVQHDWELELAVVVGRGGRQIPLETAMEHVAGYTICNDITARDALTRPGFPMSDIIMAKSRPTFFPTGPYIVPRDAVGDPSALRITLKVNGEVMQDAPVAGLMHGIDRLIAYASTIVELLPGDVLLTGSPSGNAAHHGNRWLKPGDIIESEITGLGTQSNRCVAA